MDWFIPVIRQCIYFEIKKCRLNGTNTRLEGYFGTQKELWTKHFEVGFILRLNF